METIYDKCAYKNCCNGRYTTGSHLFRFPSKQDARQKLWIRNSGNIKLEKLTVNSVRRAGLCADHFNINSFKGEDKKTLKRDAVPIRFNDLINLEKESMAVMEIKEMQRAQKEQNQIKEMEEEENTYNNEIAETSFNIDHNDKVNDQLLDRFKQTYLPAKLNFNKSLEEEDITEWMHLEPVRYENIDKCDLLMTDNCEEKYNSKKIIESLKRENICLRQTIKRLKLRLQRCQVPKKKRSKKNNKKIIQNLINEQNLHLVAKAMINLQLHTPHAAYTEEEKTLSKQLFYYSASALRRLRKAGCNFPAEQTIRRWHEEYKIIPGFCDFIFRKLQEKISKLPAEQRICALKWDEMYIKSYEEYSFSLDQIEGLVDLGPLGRKNEKTKCVFVFCVVSINAHHPWRQPLAYFLPGKCMKAEDIVILMKECLDRLSKTDADVRLITCDQGPSNQSAQNALLGVHADKTYFIHNKKNITHHLIFRIW